VQEHGSSEGMAGPVAVHYAMASGVKNKHTGCKKEQAASPANNSGSMAL